MTTQPTYNFVSPTMKFCIAGFFMPGFTAILLFGLHEGLGFLGVECRDAWLVLWTATIIGAVALPIAFLCLMHKWFLGK